MHSLSDKYIVQSRSSIHPSIKILALTRESGFLRLGILNLIFAREF